MAKKRLTLGPKNLRGRMIKDGGETVTFRNLDGRPETQPVEARDIVRGKWVVVSNSKGEPLRLWLAAVSFVLIVACSVLFLV